MVDMGLLIGTFRRFGMFGPAYEVLGLGAPGTADEPRMRVRLIETGEELDHRVRDVLVDPIED